MPHAVVLGSMTTASDAAAAMVQRSLVQMPPMHLRTNEDIQHYWERRLQEEATVGRHAVASLWTCVMRGHLDDTWLSWEWPGIDLQVRALARQVRLHEAAGQPFDWDAWLQRDEARPITSRELLGATDSGSMQPAGSMEEPQSLHELWQTQQVIETIHILQEPHERPPASEPSTKRQHTTASASSSSADAAETAPQNDSAPTQARTP